MCRCRICLSKRSICKARFVLRSSCLQESHFLHQSAFVQVNAAEDLAAKRQAQLQDKSKQLVSLEARNQEQSRHVRWLLQPNSIFLHCLAKCPALLCDDLRNVFRQLQQEVHDQSLAESSVQQMLDSKAGQLEMLQQKHSSLCEHQVRAHPLRSPAD